MGRKAGAGCLIQKKGPKRAALINPWLLLWFGREILRWSLQSNQENSCAFCLGCLDIEKHVQIWKTKKTLWLGGQRTSVPCFFVLVYENCVAFQAIRGLSYGHVETSQSTIWIVIHEKHISVDPDFPASCPKTRSLQSCLFLFQDFGTEGPPLWARNDLLNQVHGALCATRIADLICQGLCVPTKGPSARTKELFLNGNQWKSMEINGI